MDSDQGKLFIGGISWETSEDKLKEYFSNYGDVLQTVVMRDKITQRPRGFGFVVFVDPAVLDRVLQEKHTIDGRTVEAKRALSREEQQTSVRSGNPNPGRNAGSGGNVRTKKIFVGGLPPTLTEEEFREYFEAYGHVTDVVVMYDQNTGRPRGFGFISFDTEDAVDRVLHKTFHDLSGKQVEVKRALPKDANPGGGGRSLGGGQGGGGASGGGYQGYGASGGNPNAYDGRMDSNRYMQSQSTGGGFPPYGSSGYSAPSYGYAPSSNGIGYGGYGGYGGTNTGYGGPAAAAYGNPNAPTAGYGGGPPGAPRSSWSSQAPSGYGGMGYGNTAPWGVQSGSAATGSGGPGSAPAGQSPSAAAGYGAQGYGYGGYSGGDASYGNPSAYGAVGGRSGSVPNNNVGGPGGEQGSGGGYIGSGYGDSNGNAGYGNSGWRADPSQASGNYGGQANGAHGGQVGYGGYSAQARQAQQHGSSRNSSSWTNALGLEERCTSCKVKCPSWLNTSFIVGHVDWGRVQHGLGFWEVCSVMSFSSQALPTLFCRVFQPHVIHILNFTLVCCGMTECEMNSVRVKMRRHRYCGDSLWFFPPFLVYSAVLCFYTAVFF